MTFITELWLPILLSAAAVWIASAIAWMFLPHHKKDFTKMSSSSEDAVMAALRAQNLKAGMYAFPECEDHKKMNDPEFKAKLDAGPCGILHIWPADSYTKMGGKMFASFVYYLVVGVFVAYLSWHALTLGASFGRVFQIAGTAAIMAHVFATIPHDIWFNTPKNARITCLIDGVVYGVITGVIFAWMWPGPAQLSILP